MGPSDDSGNYARKSFVLSVIEENFPELRRKKFSRAKCQNVINIIFFPDFSIDDNDDSEKRRNLRLKIHSDRARASLL